MSFSIEIEQVPKISTGDRLLMSAVESQIFHLPKHVSLPGIDFSQSAEGASLRIKDGYEETDEYAFCRDLKVEVTRDEWSGGVSYVYAEAELLEIFDGFFGEPYEIKTHKEYVPGSTSNNLSKLAIFFAFRRVKKQTEN
ncbi:MAG: hypothetical protein M3P98_03025 [bacterium]|nr:hypothetical protein [bacterium]